MIPLRSEHREVLGLRSRIIQLRRKTQRLLLRTNSLRIKWVSSRRSSRKRRSKEIKPKRLIRGSKWRDKRKINSLSWLIVRMRLRRNCLNQTSIGLRSTLPTLNLPSGNTSASSLSSSTTLSRRTLPWARATSSTSKWGSLRLALIKALWKKSLPMRGKVASLQSVTLLRVLRRGLSRPRSILTKLRAPKPLLSKGREAAQRKVSRWSTKLRKIPTSSLP